MRNEIARPRELILENGQKRRKMGMKFVEWENKGLEYSYNIHFLVIYLIYCYNFNNKKTFLY